MRHLALAALVCLTTRPLALDAQTAPTGGTVVGVVRDSAGHGIAGTYVVVAGTQLRAESDDSGRYRIAGVPAGRMQIQARRLGFRPASADVDVALGAESSASLTLGAAPHSLAPVLVRGSGKQYRGRMADFYKRRDTGFGRYMTKDEIDRMNPRFLTDVLRRFPGVTLVPGYMGVRQHVRLRSGRCAPQIVMDGMPLAGSSELDLDTITPYSVEALEVYNNGATAPVELQGRNWGCGVIVIWTRLGEPRRKKESALTLAQLVEQLKVYTADQVDTPATQIEDKEVEVMFPNALLRTGKSDSLANNPGPHFAFVEFVVDTTGKADMKTFNAISATHPLFVEEVAAAIPRARWNPAVRQGRRVRQVVQQRFDFVREEKTASTP